MGKDVPNQGEPRQGKKARPKKNEWLFVNPYLIVGIVGASFCFAWFFSVLLTPDFVSIGMGSAWLPPLLHVAFAGALLVAYVAIWRFSNVLQRHRGVLLGAAMVCGLMGTAPGGGAFV